ncbi:sulfite exporter TauE/SafE family protein [uncultured Roseovarius sp.]|uniref:sulfite exporter TauE/SafE family protein n=1 Tax=uncultured Roseovarius sp. TaxID=293344 RepID=UPI00260986D9|nr:sulfite exporter TauE/SafE family protein [uncultured Roseovarius sp.]
MPDILAQVLATPGLVWLILTISVAGIVRGFTGFGTAMIFVPIAGIFLQPATVVTVMVLTGIASTAALIPRAWRQASRAEVGLLALAAMITVPVGLWFLVLLDQLTVRWIVAAIVGSTFILLVAGWRFSGTIRWPGLLMIGGAAGAIGGLTGLTGPIVVLFYLAGKSAAQTIRANTILFLAALDVVIAGNLLLRGTVGLAEVALAATLAVPYFITTMIGQALFDPKLERFYRVAAYAVIGLAVVSGLPLWG